MGCALGLMWRLRLPLLSTCTTVLKDINDWAERNPKEILILAFSNFRGSGKKIEEHLHNHLINFIKTLFGDKRFLRKVSLYVA
ncbi:PI-PLC X domain-containing protein 1-like [Thunnus albacares]|uniref:PI-PLC X domain-containing protein 1-like n=1 Tax=Thunnus albacares TaxID=8236 RepID=UPI001CF71539|nr:PI-PLC X domain-containing protein 1-like [Thunnus albacares]